MIFTHNNRPTRSPCSKPLMSNVLSFRQLSSWLSTLNLNNCVCVVYTAAPRQILYWCVWYSINKHEHTYIHGTKKTPTRDVVITLFTAKITRFAGAICHLSATIESGLPQKLSNTASIALSDSSRLAMPLVAAFTSPPNASFRAGSPSGPLGHPLNFAVRRFSCRLKRK